LKYFLTQATQQSHGNLEDYRLPYQSGKTDVHVINYGGWRHVFNNPRAWVLEFYAPWCKHCKRFASTYVELAKHYKYLIDFAAINCEFEENKPLCELFEISSYPSVFIMPPNVPEGGFNLKASLAKNYIVKYVGKKEYHEMKSYLLGYSPKSVTTLAPANVENWLTKTNPHLPHALLLTDNKEKPNEIFTAAAAELTGSMECAQTGKFGLEKRLRLKKTPAIVVFDGNSKSLKSTPVGIFYGDRIDLERFDRIGVLQTVVFLSDLSYGLNNERREKYRQEKDKENMRFMAPPPLEKKKDKPAVEAEQFRARNYKKNIN